MHTRTNHNRSAVEPLILRAEPPRDRKHAVRENKAFEVGYRTRHKNEDGRHLSEHGTPGAGVSRHPPQIDGLIIDVAEHKRLMQRLEKSEAALRGLSARLLTAQEDERAGIARELHDGIGQNLVSIRFRLEHALCLIGHDDRKAHKLLRSLAPMICTSVDEVRRIAAGLRPAILDDLGIIATISWFCRQFHATYPDIRIDIDMPITEQEIPSPLRLVIYRTLQEALNNVAKHAKADHVRIRFTRSRNVIELAVEDNGRGFQPKRMLSLPPTKKGFGLSCIRKRAQLFGGRCSIMSAPGAGAIIRASWPVPVRTA